MKSLSVIIQMKVIKHYFPAVLSCCDGSKALLSSGTLPTENFKELFLKFLVWHFMEVKAKLLKRNLGEVPIFSNNLA